MKKVWKQNVFYDKGEIQADGVMVAWMDFRAFCMDGSLYSMLFLFQTIKSKVNHHNTASVTMRIKDEYREQYLGMLTR